MDTAHDPSSTTPTHDVRPQSEQPDAATSGAIRVKLESGALESRAQERFLREQQLKKTVLRVGVGLLAGVVFAGLLVLTVMYS